MKETIKIFFAFLTLLIFFGATDAYGAVTCTNTWTRDGNSYSYLFHSDHHISGTVNWPNYSYNGSSYNATINFVGAAGQYSDCLTQSQFDTGQNWLYDSDMSYAIGNNVTSRTLSCGNTHTYSWSLNAINGSCGSANGLSTSIIPTTNLCNVGGTPQVNGTGPWTWTCPGSNSGTDASCSAPKCVANKYEIISGSRNRSQFIAACQAKGAGWDIAYVNSTTERINIFSFMIGKGDAMIGDRANAGFISPKCSRETTWPENWKSIMVEASCFSDVPDNEYYDQVLCEYTGTDLCALSNLGCSSSPDGTATIDQSVAWTANTGGQKGTYSYSWSGTDSLTGSSALVTKSYNTCGYKNATTTVTSSDVSQSVTCPPIYISLIAPANLVATNLGCANGTRLTWSASTDATSYEVYRGGSLLNSTASLTYTDNSITTSGTYTYHVIAKKSSDASPASNSATVSYLATCGDMFVSCTATSTDKSAYISPVTVRWTATTTASSTTGYSWTGTDGLSGSSVSVSKLYTIAGMKKASTTASYTKYSTDTSINGTVKVLVVGGGAGVGGGVNGTTYHAGGGGGRVSTSSAYLISGTSPLTINVVVGSGGNNNGNGATSTFGTLNSAGGRTGRTTAHGGWSGSGYDGGAWTGSGTGGAGGGGAGGTGFSNSGNTPGNGGAGIVSTLSGTSSVTYGAGGKGGTAGNTVHGAANTGTGGGGEYGNGGSGVVIVRYNTADFGTVTGGTKTVIGSETIHKFTSSGTITFNPKIVANGTASVTVPCPGDYVVDSSDVCVNCNTDPSITILPPNPVLDPNLNCGGFAVKPGATSTLNTNTVWTVSSPTCSSCYSEWKINGAIDQNSTATKTLRYIPTTVGVKGISVYFGSVTGLNSEGEPTGTYGLPCTASTTVIQTGGGIKEI